eukprot:COSAG04_NODE_1508_length_6503_cov_4.125547_5_plen_588_part_00
MAGADLAAAFEMAKTMIVAVRAEDVAALRAAVEACSAAELDMTGVGGTALLGACHKGSVECIQMLARAGCDTAAADNEDENALMCATHSGVPAAVRLVLDEGWCELEATNDIGETAFLIACRRGYADIMEMLVDEDCDTAAISSQGRNALMCSACSGVPAALRMAVDEGWCTLEARDTDNGRTAFLWAANQGHADCMQILADAGCDTDATSATNLGSALSNAVASHVPAAVRLALEKRWGELEARNDDDGFTAFLGACFEGHTEIMEMLVDAGCDTSAKLSNGMTATDIAKLVAEEDNDDALLNRLRELLYERKTQQKVGALEKEAHDLMGAERFQEAAAVITKALVHKPTCAKLQAALGKAEARTVEKREKQERAAAQAEVQLLAMLDDEEKQKEKTRKKIKNESEDAVLSVEDEAERKEKKRQKRARQRERQRQAKLAAAAHAEPEPESQAEPKQKIEEKPLPEPQPDAQPEKSSEPEAEKKRKKRARQREKKREAKLAAARAEEEPEPEPEPEPQPQPQPEPQAEPEPKPEPEPATDPVPVGVPDEYLCPISQELMVDPVLCVASGHTYERCAPILSRVRATEF